MEEAESTPLPHNLASEHGTPIVGSSVSASSAFYNSIDNWVFYGQPYLNEVLSQVFKKGEIDKMTRLLLFSILGGFSQAFSNSWKISDYENEVRFSEAFAAGMTRLSMTPEISAMAENFIKGHVDEKVGGMV